jgi:cyclic beta-1,2-glucan synthetase
VAGPDGRSATASPLLSRWKILDNLRRSTVEIGQLAVPVAGWTLLPGSPLRWTRSASAPSPRRGSSLLLARAPPAARPVVARLLRRRWGETR